VAAETAKRRRSLVAQSIETHAPHAELDALAAALAERLHLQNGSPWMSTAEAAEYLRVSVRWLRQHLHQVPHSKVEGRLFFSRTELDAWLAGKRRS
jgi:excisionase family DNA binding protein